MGNRSKQRYESYTIFRTSLGPDQNHLTAAVTDPQADPVVVYKEIYEKIISELNPQGMQIVFERYFGDNALQKSIARAREQVLDAHHIGTDLPYTYIQGRPLWGNGFAGLQMRTTRSKNAKDVWTIYHQDQAQGRAWKLNGTTYIMLQNIHGYEAAPGADNSRAQQTARMFQRVNDLLKTQGAGYQNVVRTWIYLSRILEWYSEFNTVRNKKYAEFRLLSDTVPQSAAEQIYLPASTGIEGDNPIGAAGITDALAIVHEPDANIHITQTSGVKQKSAYRYGSAFSRAMSIREPQLTQVLVSGTASIDEQGHSVHFNDMRGQIMKTIEVVNALVAHEGASLQDIYDATVFIKQPGDIQTYLKVADELGLNDLPAVCVLADVCRDELLFELDAAVSLENGKL